MRNVTSNLLVPTTMLLATLTVLVLVAALTMMLATLSILAALTRVVVALTVAREWNQTLCPMEKEVVSVPSHIQLLLRRLLLLAMPISGGIVKVNKYP